VSEEFSIGSTSAKQVCHRHGFNPDQLAYRNG
jgi:hypothetical protein